MKDNPKKLKGSDLVEEGFLFRLPVTDEQGSSLVRSLCEDRTPSEFINLFN